MYLKSIVFGDINQFLILKSDQYLLIALILISLSFLNWMGEVIKWQKLVLNIDFKSSAKQSLISHSLALFTPQKLGEYGGKCMFYPKAQSYKIVALTASSHLTQLLTTICFGLLGILILASQINITEIFAFKWSWLFIIIPCLFGFKIIRKQFKKMYSEFEKIEGSIFKKALFWSVFRYLMFSHQFLVLMWVFGIDIGYVEGMAVISLVYLTASLLPVFALADAVVKGSVALTIMSLIGYPNPALLVISFLMWMSNVMFPALLGYIWMLFWKPELLVKTS